VTPKKTFTPSAASKKLAAAKNRPGARRATQVARGYANPPKPSNSTLIGSIVGDIVKQYPGKKKKPRVKGKKKK